jgi:hypothetical protein
LVRSGFSVRGFKLSFCLDLGLLQRKKQLFMAASFVSLFFIEPPVLALAGCIPAEPVSFLKGKSNVAIIQVVCNIIYYIVFICYIVTVLSG